MSEEEFNEETKHGVFIWLTTKDLKNMIIGTGKISYDQIKNMTMSELIDIYSELTKEKLEVYLP